MTALGFVKLRMRCHRERRKEGVGMGDGDIAASTAIALHFLCALGLGAGYSLAQLKHHLSLVADPAQTLRFLLVVQGPVVIGIYSSVRRDREHCSYWKAVARGLFGLPVGAVLNAFGAIVLGAPVGIKYWPSTIYWSSLMSLFTFVPALCVFGLSKMDWQRILAHSIPKEIVDCVVSLPAQGAILGAWLGAWPMPLDWEKPWQEWPICVTYGAVAGYLFGMLISVVFVHVLRGQTHVKAE
ncbi:phosphatidylinositol-glycan biosynthesis class F protein isoform X1 [Canna indica]|uniref:Phosphatidylinositol-glycan biosynthesis class F protein isoform X1 n=1 Tax=Canna indica TaxID=4628 RepID=A0AAQ3KEJ2_9LILI|nr:phosphatidylinositol-glycan biosynthesis class F protein isoform X1 [Canna indica]